VAQKLREKGFRKKATAERGTHGKLENVDVWNNYNMHVKG
jgi:hypothetical protein